MKSANTNTLTEFLLYDVIGGSSPKPIIKTEYYDEDSSSWVAFEDVESRTLEVSNKNKRYSSYSFMPPVKTMNMNLNNYGQIYSTGSGNTKASILKKNLKVRCWSGYEVIDGLEDTISLTGDLSSTAKMYHTKIDSGSVVLDITTYTGATIATAAEIGGGEMGTITYGTIPYGYAGYHTKTFRVTDEMDLVSFDVNVSSNVFSMKYRKSKFSDFRDTSWSSYSTLNTGSNVVSLLEDVPDNEYIQVMTRFNHDNWTDTDSINSINLTYYNVHELFKRGVFIIDEPKYNDKVSIEGRDPLKKALETEINLQDLTTSKTVTKRLEEVFDRCNIDYNTSEWDTISTTCSIVNSDIAQSYTNISAWKMCDLLMDTVNAGDDDIYFTFNEDGRAVIKKQDTDVEADWVTHYKYNIESVSKNFDSDSQLQRCTVLNKDISVDPESTLGTFTGTANTAGTLHVLHSSGASKIYVRYIDNNSTILTETNRTNTAIDFTVTPLTPYNITVMGCTPSGITTEIWQERGNANNIIKNEGSTYNKVNPFMDNTKGKAFVDYIMDKNGDPKYTMTVKQQANPLLEVGNDNVMVFDKYTFSDNIYGLESIKESWGNPSLKETITLKDRGFDLGSLIYDRNGTYSGVNDLKIDTGFVWELDLGPNATADSTDYSDTKEILFT